MAHLTTVLAIDLYLAWGENRGYPNADRTFYWHDDSEIIALEERLDGDFDVEYADGTLATIPRFALIYIQPIKWSTDVPDTEI
jgi:hypothetical protein